MSRAAGIMIRITVTGILFLLLFTGCASAAGGRVLVASCPSLCAEKVTAREGKNGLILSIPGFWDLSRIALEVEGSEKLFIGKDRTEITPGEETDLSGLKDQKVRITDEIRELGPLTILQGSQIPALFLTVDGNELKKIKHSKNNEITEGRMVYMESDGTLTYDGTLTQLRCRGNNSFLYTKKPYQLKLSESASLSGMGKGKTWVMLANHVDESLLRNQIVLDLCRVIGLKYAVDCVPADVWINGEYNGLYLLTEKIQIRKERVDITNLEKATEAVNDTPFQPGAIFTEKSRTYPILRSYPEIRDPEDITGGYIMTIEKPARMKNYVVAGFKTSKELNIRIKEPTYPSRAQAEYLFERVSQTQRALMAKDGIDPESGKSFETLLDEQSFAQKFLIEEWCKNYDFFGGSQYLYKDSDLVDPLIYAGPGWDYDLCFGNMKDRGYPAAGKYLTSYRKNSNLFWLLYQHESFREKVGKIWKETFRPAVAVLLGETRAEQDGILCSLDEYRERIRASAEMNTRRWGISNAATAGGGGFDKAVKYMKQWITDRTAWMDSEYTPETGE